MWADHALPRLDADGLGADMATRTYRLTGIGESQVADRLGEDLLRGANPVVATYARVEAVDVRISAVGDSRADADDLLETTAGAVLDRLGEFVWATGDTTWSGAIGERLGELGWSLGVVELGTAGQVAALLGDAAWLRFDETLGLDTPGAVAHGAIDDDDRVEPVLSAYAGRARDLGGCDVGIAVLAVPHGGDTITRIAVVTPSGTRHARRVVFLDGPNGRSRAALASAAVLLEALRASERPPSV
jgi:nicotinamide-nucleotide amidase